MAKIFLTVGLALAFVVNVGCDARAHPDEPPSRSTAAAAAPLAPSSVTSAMASPQDVPGLSSYLCVGDGEASLLQWPTDPAGAIDGTVDAAFRSGQPPNEKVTTNTESFSGRISGGSVAFYIEGTTDYGTLSRDALTLNVRQPDGSIQPVTCQRGSAADYNKSLAALNGEVTRENAQATQQQHLRNDETALATAYQDSTDAENTIRSDGSAVTQATAKTGQALDTTRAAEQHALGEIGTADPASVCYDVESEVEYDAQSDVEYEAQSDVEYNVSALTRDLATLRGDLSQTTDALAAVEQDLPGFTGDDKAPSPSAVHQLLMSSQSLMAQSVSQANADIDNANSDVATAYQYAAQAVAAASCGTAPAIPSALQHIS